MPAVQTVAFLGDLAKGIDARFLEVFDENADTYKSNLPLLFKKLSSEKTRERTKLKAGTGFLVRKTEGDTITRGSQLPAYTTEYVHDTYGKGVSVTMEEIQDRDWSDKLDEFKDLSVTASVSMDQAMAQVLNGGFATTATVNGYQVSHLNDGVPLFSTIHPRYDGGASQSNASSTSVPLSDTSLDVARRSIIAQLADDGKPLAIMGKFLLVVPPSLEKLAVQLTDSELEATTANNAMNFYKGKIDVLVVNWLGAAAGGSDTAWFLAVANQSKLIWMQRLAPTFDQTVDSNTKNRNYDVVCRWSVGYSDWRYTWASKGDNSAYSS